VGLALELLVWWVVAIGVWLTSLSAYSRQDLIVAVGCGLPCAVMAVLARRAVRLRMRPPADAVRWLTALPPAVAGDTVRVLALPWRPSRRSTAGEFRTVDLRARGRTPAASGRRAVATVLLSSTPGSYVVDVDPDTGTALIHAVGPPSAIERRVAR
jgi:multisubunit Na+/H+ antiporter MnhE subunit